MATHYVKCATCKVGRETKWIVTGKPVPMNNHGRSPASLANLPLGPRSQQKYRLTKPHERREDKSPRNAYGKGRIALEEVWGTRP